jgi:hypothetical protein
MRPEDHPHEATRAERAHHASPATHAGDEARRDAVRERARDGDGECDVGEEGLTVVGEGHGPRRA